MTRSDAGTKGVPRVDREPQILDVACRAFGTDGYRNTSVALVAHLAGISKPLVYSYFDSKDGLSLACVERAGALLSTEVEAVARAVGPIGIIDSLMAWWVDHPDESAEQMLHRCSRLITALLDAPARQEVSS